MDNDARLVLSEDTRWLAVADTGRRVRIVPVGGGTGATLAASGESPRVALSRDGARVALAAEMTVEVWDRASGRRLAMLPHEWYLTAMRFSRGGRYLATVTGSASIDEGNPDATRLVGSTIRVWDVESRLEVARIPLAEEGVISGIAFSADGDWLLTTTWGETAAWVWNLWPDALRREACAHLKRNLSPPEAQLYLGRDDPPVTCPGLPIPNGDGGDSSADEGG